MTLAEHIKETAGKRFSLDGYNCAYFPAEWVIARTGLDPLAIFGGLPGWRSRDFLARGRMLAAFARGCRSVGLTRTDLPTMGDVGVIRCALQHRCAIRGRDAWVYFDETGLSIVSAEFATALGVWSVP